MKKIIFNTLITLLIVSPTAVYSLEKKWQDDKGYRYYECDARSGDRIKIIAVDKGRYKVLGSYTGRIIRATSAYDAAMIACGEKQKKPAGRPEQTTE